MQTLWYDNLLRAMPAGLIQHQNDLFVCSCTHRPSEFGQRQGGGRNRYARQQQPEGLTTARTDETVLVHPFVAMLNRHDWSLAALAPDPPNDWFEPDPMLVHCPQLYLACGMGGAERL